MSGLQDIEREINSTKNLGSIVGTMKAHASSTITQFQRGATAAWEYKNILDKSLHIVFLNQQPQKSSEIEGQTMHIIFGSDHGLAGRFNERIAHYSLQKIKEKNQSIYILLGQQVRQRLADDLSTHVFLHLPHTIENVTNKVNTLLLKIDELRDEHSIGKIILHYNKPIDKITFKETSEVLFPIDFDAYGVEKIEWDSNRIPSYFTNREALMSSLIQQYLFITLYRAFCYSLASENASRLSSMQSAEKNIDARLDELNSEYRSKRQNSITEEINDIISGFKVIRKSRK